jgi:hypothetical protein
VRARGMREFPSVKNREVNSRLVALDRVPINTLATLPAPLSPPAPTLTLGIERCRRAEYEKTIE